MASPLILSIDDDPDVLMFIETVLKSKGYDVVTAETAEQGLRIFKEKKPDMVIVDLMMEEVDAGTNFVRELKVMREDIPVFMLSSVGNALNMNTNFADLGLKGVLQKPIEPDTLLALVEKTVGKPKSD